jgi:hypothetical protein
MNHRLMLIGCSKTKKPIPAGITRMNWVTPEQLYGSQLFAKRVKNATERGIPWAALSARYGVWHPATMLKPYDMTFSHMNAAEKAAWHVGVAMRLVEHLWEPFNQEKTDDAIKPKQLTIEIHAGSEYCDPLADILRAVGINVELPCEGLGIGEQLSLYSNPREAWVMQT